MNDGIACISLVGEWVLRERCIEVQRGNFLHRNSTVAIRKQMKRGGREVVVVVVVVTVVKEVSLSALSFSCLLLAIFQRLDFALEWIRCRLKTSHIHFHIHFNG